jgi:DNA-binding SARP family transcriptional activator/tetratricopeptide (TPR) repeat protein
MSAEFHLLGEVEVCVDGQSVPIRGARQQGILAVLLVEANRPVSADQVLERVWGSGRLPDRPANALQSQITLLRRALRSVGGVTITWQASGYRLTVAEQAVDVHLFRRLVTEAHATDDDDRAAALFERALGLWRGEPFASLDSPWFAAQRDTLAMRRHAARLDFTDTRLRRGEHAALVAELPDQTAAHPWDERIAGQSMLALYRAGRSGDALTTYQQVRRRLADELGTDPGAALGELHQRILAADPTLTLPAVATARVRPPAPVPRQLPPAPVPFTGRVAELDVLDAAERPGSTAVVRVISGGGGVGKTWLALHWAHGAIERFPDGQLYVNLRGFDPSGQPLRPQAAVRGFLDSLGADAATIPVDLDAQVGFYRSLVADRRMLIVADNAADAAQVTPLLPGSPSCTVLVTSRFRLAGLSTAHGARLLDLDLMSGAEARDLLVRHLGPERPAAEPAAVAELLDLCAGLPLALSIVAARAAHHPDFPLAALAEELRDVPGRLDALDAGDLHANLRAVLSWSYHALDARAAGVFVLLGLASGPDISVSAAASLTALPVGQVRGVLRTLENASLVQQHAPGRYRMHDLVRLHAGEQAEQHLTADARTAATRRLVDFYLHTVGAADRLINPQRVLLPVDPPAEGSGTHPLADADAASRWLRAERACLLGAQELAASRDWHTAVWQLAWLMETFLYRHGRIQERIDYWRAAQVAADHLDDLDFRCRAHRNLGRAYFAGGRNAEGLHHLAHALALAERAADSGNQAHIHYVLTLYWGQQDDSHRALAHATRAHTLFLDVADPMWAAIALNGVGWHQARLGRYEQARETCERALVACHEYRYQDSEVVTLQSLGYIAHQTGRLTEAIDHYHQALAICREVGNTSEVAATLTLLGKVQADADHRAEAGESWGEALRIYLGQNRTVSVEQVLEMINSL